MSVSIIVLCPHGLDRGLLTKAAEMASGTPVHVLVPEEDSNDACKFGGSRVHVIRKLPQDERLTSLFLKDLILKWECNIVLAPATVQMRNIMPMLAYYLQAGLTADCTNLSVVEDQLLQTRPAFGNSLMATIQTLSPIQMATVRPGTFRETANPIDDPQIIYEPTLQTYGSVKLLNTQPYLNGTPLGQAHIIIAGGAGIGSRDGFRKLELFAAKIGGSVAASRSAVDAGFAPFRCQVGMTGITVSPKLYIAVGISGAVQHLAGMSGSEKVIAINSDPKAPIFDYADYGIVGDWETVIDKVLEELS